MKHNNIILKTIIIAMVALLITSCSSKKDTDKKLKTFVLKQPGIEMKIEYFGKDDTAFKQTIESKIVYDKFPAKGEALEKLKKEIKKISDQYKNLKGVEYKINFAKEGITEKTTMNYRKVEFEKIKKIPGMMFTEDPVNGVSLKKTIPMLEKQGFKEVK
ncbi:MAG: hypothetical protein CSB15_00130 [Clostridiales bacterium]|nr:MAG: hypothetical protein CSB15_00130 [Clostridiales bacterium]